MKCEQCKHEIDDKLKFCPHCGTPIHLRTQQEFTNTLKKINKKKMLYKNLLSIASISMLAIPIIFSSLLIGIATLVIILGVDTFLGAKIAKLNREELLLKRDHEVNQSSFSDIQVPTSNQIDTPSSIMNTAYASPTNLEDNANKNIKRFLFLDTTLLAIVTVGLVLFGLLLLFVPFFYVIVDDTSVYELTKSSMLWNLGNENNFEYSNVLVDILNEAPITNFLFKDSDTALSIVGVSFILLFSMPFISTIGLIKRIYITIKYNSNKKFKQAVLYKYNTETRPSYTFGGIVFFLIMVTIFLPASDYLFYLQTYFNGLVNEFYIVTLICFMLALVLMFLYPIILGIKYKDDYKQAAFALKPDKK